MDHVLRYQDTPGVKMIVVLGEVSVPFIQPLAPFFLPFKHDTQYDYGCNMTLMSLLFTYRLEEMKSTRFATALKKAGSPNLWSAGASEPVPPCSPLRCV